MFPEFLNKRYSRLDLGSYGELREQLDGDDEMEEEKLERVELGCIGTCLETKSSSSESFSAEYTVVDGSAKLQSC
jgi:hypothetical protein